MNLDTLLSVAIPLVVMLIAWALWQLDREDREDF